MTIERMKTGSPLRNAPLYDWDALVQEDRVHRLIYTDQAIFDAEMTHIFGGTWFTSPTKARSRTPTITSRRSSDSGR